MLLYLQPAKISCGNKGMKTEEILKIFIKENKFHMNNIHNIFQDKFSHTTHLILIILEEIFKH
jgi:hypothetical protein